MFASSNKVRTSFFKGSNPFANINLMNVDNRKITNEDVRFYLHRNFGLDVDPYQRIVPGTKRVFFILYSSSEKVYRYGYGPFRYNLFFDFNTAHSKPHSLDTIIFVACSSKQSDIDNWDDCHDLDKLYRSWLCRDHNKTVGWVHVFKCGKRGKAYSHPDCQVDLQNYLKWYAKRERNFKKDFNILDLETIQKLNQNIRPRGLRPTVLDFAQFIENIETG